MKLVFPLVSVFLAALSVSFSQSLPVPREETVVLEDPAIFTVFGSFNNRIPQGNEFANGYQQIAQEYLFLANFTTGEIEPWRATSYTYNDDYTELTLKLRDDVTWNDGVPFTADDVVVTYQAVIKEDKLGGIGLREQVQNVSAPDKTTVRFVFKRPEPRFIYGLYGQVTGFTVWPKHVWESEDPLTFKNNLPVTTAAYKLKQVLPTLRMFVWERNETYWNRGERFPEAKYIVVRTAPASPDADLQELIANTIDVGRTVQWFQVELAQQSDPTISATVFQDPCPRVVSFNTQRQPFDDPAFRWALSYAIDREKIATVISQPATVPATHPWSDYELLERFLDPGVLERYPLTFDPDRANQLLDELGYKVGANGVRVGPDGNPLAYTLLTVDQVGTAPYETAQEIAAGMKGSAST